MYLIDTNVVSEARKGERCNPGVRRFFNEVRESGADCFISVITLGELRRGVEIIRHRGDAAQARLLGKWLTKLVADYTDHILSFDADEAQVWGRLRVPRPENAIDKQIAATALTHELTVVTRNLADFEGMGLSLINPFSA